MLLCDHSNESYWAVLSCSTVCSAVQDFFSFFCNLSRLWSLHWGQSRSSVNQSTPVPRVSPVSPCIPMSPMSPCVPCDPLLPPVSFVSLVSPVIPVSFCVPCDPLCPLCPLVSPVSPYVPCGPLCPLCHPMSPFVPLCSLCPLVSPVSPCVPCVPLYPLCPPVSPCVPVSSMSPCVPLWSPINPSNHLFTFLTPSLFEFWTVIAWLTKGSYSLMQCVFFFICIHAFKICFLQSSAWIIEVFWRAFLIKPSKECHILIGQWSFGVRCKLH